jgi:glycosyltransferase involved in cell wall biosynthesis
MTTEEKGSRVDEERAPRLRPDSERGRAGLVTVVIATYNYAHFIAQTLDSVLAQTYPNWECIVVDDGSTDNTREVVERYTEADQRIRYLWQENQRLAAARNTGIANSSGEYLQFLDADDLIESRKLECQVGVLEHHQELDIVYSDVRYIAAEKSDGRRLTAAEVNIPDVVRLSGQGKEVLSALARGNITPTNCILLRRQVISSVGPFKARANEAYDYWVRCALDGKRFHFEDHDGARALVRLHPASMSRDRRMMIRSELLVHQTIANSVSDRDVLLLNQQRMAELEGQIGIEEATYRHLAKAIPQFYKAAMMDRRWRSWAKWLAYACAAPFVTPAGLRKVVNSTRLRSPGQMSARTGKSDRLAR